jgi:hypothetical protein
MTGDQADGSGPGSPGELSEGQRMAIGAAIVALWFVSIIAIVVAAQAVILLFNPVSFGFSAMSPTGILVDNRTGGSLYLQWMGPGDGEPRWRLDWHHGARHFLNRDEFVIMPVTEIMDHGRSIAIRYQLSQDNHQT